MFALQGIWGILVFLHDHLTELWLFSFIYKYVYIYVSICLVQTTNHLWFERS